MITDILGNPLAEGIYTARFGRRSARLQLIDDVEAGTMVVKNLDTADRPMRLDELPSADLLTWTPAGVETDPDDESPDLSAVSEAEANPYLAKLTQMEACDTELADFRSVLNRFEDRVAAILGIGTATEAEADLIHEFLCGFVSPAVAILRAQSLATGR